MNGIAELYRLAEVEAGKPAPMMLFPIGEWTSTDYPDLTLSQAYADEVKANFDAGVLRTKVPVESVGKHDGTSPAGGWFERLYMAPFEWQGVAGEALYGDWVPNERGAQLVNDGEYAYNSVDIAPHKDPVTGDVTPNVLKAVALTNRPVLRQMPPVKDAGDALKLAEQVTIQLSEVTAAEPDPVQSILDDMDSLAAKADAAMKGKKGMPDFRAMMRQARQKVMAHALSEDPDGNPLEPHPASSDGSSQLAKADEGQPMTLAEGSAATKGSDPMNPKLITALKLSEGASDEAIEAAVLQLSEERDAEKTRADAAELRLAETEKAAAIAAFTVKLDEKIRVENTIAPGERDTYLARAQKDVKLAEELIAERTHKVIDVVEHGSGVRVAGDPEKRADIELAERSKARAAKDSVSFSQAKRLELAEDPDLKTRYEEFRAGKEG